MGGAWSGSHPRVLHTAYLYKRARNVDGLKKEGVVGGGGPVGLPEEVGTARIHSTPRESHRRDAHVPSPVLRLPVASSLLRCRVAGRSEYYLATGPPSRLGLGRRALTLGGLVPGRAPRPVGGPRVGRPRRARKQEGPHAQAQSRPRGSRSASTPRCGAQTPGRRPSPGAGWGQAAAQPAE